MRRADDGGCGAGTTRQLRLLTLRQGPVHHPIRQYVAGRAFNSGTCLQEGLRVGSNSVVSELTVPPGRGSSESCVMTIIRKAALAALLLSTCGTSVVLAQPAAGLFEGPPENMRLLCRPVTVRQAGAAVRLWRCPPRVTSALSPAAREVSRMLIPTVSMRPTRIGHKAKAARDGRHGARRDARECQRHAHG